VGGDPETLADIESMGLAFGINPAIPVGTGADTDVFIREPGNILYEPTDTGKEYKTWYSGYTAAGNDQKIHYAYSSNGKSWTKAGAVIAERHEDPYVIKVGATYYMYVEDYSPGSSIQRYHSDDLETWTSDGNVTGITECQSPIVWKEGATWYMIYERYPTNKDIALATSSDGLAWTADASNPIYVLADVVWGDGSIVDVVPDDIIKVGSTYYMTYHAYLVNVAHTGIAISTDLTTWTDHASNPIVPYMQAPMTSAPSAQFINDGNLAILYQPRGNGSEDGNGMYYAYPIQPA
jgi:predicted GH43/DUF377 family glycosyl hydrolase